MRFLKLLQLILKHLKIKKPTKMSIIKEYNNNKEGWGTNIGSGFW